MDKLKERIKRKRIKKEKVRLRKRCKKPKKRKYVIIQIEDLPLEMEQKLRIIAKKKHLSVPKLISRYLSKTMREEQWNLNVE